MKTTIELAREACQTCNASHKNTVERFVRCGTCKVRAVGMPTKWQSKGIQKLEAP